MKTLGIILLCLAIAISLLLFLQDISSAESFSVQSIKRLDQVGRAADNGLYAHEKEARKARSIAKQQGESFITIGTATRYF